MLANGLFILYSCWSSEPKLRIPRPAHLNVVFCKDFNDPTVEFNVPAAQHKEVFNIVQCTGEIVTGWLTCDPDWTGQLTRACAGVRQS
jgi:hypothetical protein